MAATNPIGSLYDDFIDILNSAVIKYNYLAEEYESLSMRKIVDAYFDAYYERDTFETYTYDEDELRAAGMISEEEIIEALEDQSTIPDIYRDTLLANKRDYIITNYVEENNYYRMLNGLPDLDDEDYIYVDDDIADQYNIDNTVPIHLIEDTLGSSYISILESIGYIDALIEEYPDKKYLNYLGSKRITYDVSREAKNFALLYVDSNITENVLTKFVQVYDSCREYYVNTLYIYEYRNVIDYYDQFIALCIMVMAMQQTISRSMESSIKREFFDDYAVKLLYSVYNIPYLSTIDSSTQKAIVQNLNLLIQNKASNKVIYDIASLLGFDQVQIYCYYLMRERLLDANGDPITVTTYEENDDGEMEEVLDYESMFDVYFQKVELNDYDYHQALQDQANRVSYDDVTTGDPYWWEDEDLHEEVWETEYNFKETKYLGLTLSYKLSELVYENVLLLRMILDKKDELSEIMVDLPKILDSGKLDIFTTVVLLCALVCKKYHLTGEVVCSPTQTLHVLDTIDETYTPETAYNCLQFDFSSLLPANYDETTMEALSYMTEDEVALFESYVSILAVSGSTDEEKIEALNSMYANIKNLSKFLSAKIAASETIEEYRVYTKLFKTIFYCDATADAFAIKDSDGNTTTASTFMEYLEYANPAVYEFVESLEEDYYYMYIDHVIDGLEEIIDEINYLYLINDSTSTLQEVLITMIKFFKSYTTDLIGLNIVYIFDFKPDNLFKLLDEVAGIEKDLQVDDKLNFGYSDYVKIHGRVYPISLLKLRDKVYLTKNIEMEDESFSFSDECWVVETT